MTRRRYNRVMRAIRRFSDAKYTLAEYQADLRKTMSILSEVNKGFRKIDHKHRQDYKNFRSNLNDQLSMEEMSTIGVAKNLIRDSAQRTSHLLNRMRKESGGG